MLLRLGSGLIRSGPLPSLRTLNLDAIDPDPENAQTGARGSDLIAHQFPGGYRYWIGQAGYDHDGRYIYAIQGKILTSAQSPREEGAHALRLLLGYHAIVRHPNFGTLLDPIVDYGGIMSTLDQLEPDGECTIGSWFWCFLVVIGIR
jgi:hypothetical protein